MSCSCTNSSLQDSEEKFDTKKMTNKEALVTGTIGLGLGIGISKVVSKTKKKKKSGLNDSCKKNNAKKRKNTTNKGK